MTWRSNIPRAYTSCEMIVFGILNELGIRFRSQAPIHTQSQDYIVDFLILEPPEHIIEVLGRAVHDHSTIQRRKAQAKREALIQGKYFLLEIWDDELKRKSDLPKIKEKIRQFISG